MWTCSSFAPSGVSLNKIRDPPEHVRGLRVRSRAVPTTTYHSTSLREAKVQTVTLGGEGRVGREEGGEGGEGREEGGKDDLS